MTLPTVPACESCDLDATRELSFVVVTDDGFPEGRTIPVCHSQQCFDAALSTIEFDYCGEYRETITYPRVPAPREIPETERTAKNSPAWFGKHQSDPAVAPRQERIERPEFDAKGFPTGREETITNLYATCLDCGHEYRMTATGSSRELCPVNGPAHEARLAEYRRKLLAA